MKALLLLLFPLFVHATSPEDALYYERVHVGTCSNKGGATAACLITQKDDYLYVNLLWKKHGKMEVFMVVRKHKQTGDENIVWMQELLRV